MSRHFSIPKILRMTPNVPLREFFERLEVNLLCIDWRRLKERQAGAIAHLIRLLPPAAQAEIEAALSAIFELACDSGIHAILEASCRSGPAGVSNRFPHETGPYHKAMWVWLHEPEVFEQATLMHQAEGLTRWRKRNDLPHAETRTTSDAIAELARALSELLRREEGRGQRCTVEHFRRDDGTDYFVAWPDDFVQTVAVHDRDGELTPRSIRRTFEIVFGYNREDGTLELFARVPPALKPELEILFAWIILDENIGPRQNGRAYNLDRLKDRYFRLDTDPEDRLLVSIDRLRLDLPRRGRVVLQPYRDGYTNDVYEMFDECLNTNSVSWDAVRISMATFRFEFQPVNGHRGATLILDVTWPDRCHVNTRRPDQIDLTRKYLKRWRIANV